MTPKNIALASLFISFILVSLAVYTMMENKKKEAALKAPCSCTDHALETDNYPGGTANTHTTV